MGELLTIVDTEDTPNPHFSMMAIVDGLVDGMISNVFVRDGQNGPILMDLRPLMQMQHFGDYGSLLTIPDAVMPPHVVQCIGAGNAYVSMEFPPWIHPDGAIGGAVSLVQKPRLPGDYNLDDVVDAGDYVIWRKTLGQVGPGLAADGDSNGHIDIGDLNFWRANFGRTAGAGPNPHDVHEVPEPAVALLLLIGAIPAIWKRRRHVSPASS
jgi:hypothetical protein